MNAMIAMIEAELRYCVDTGEKPVTATTGPGGRLRRRSGGRDDLRTVAIHDARARAPQLEREGFELVEAPTKVRDLWDEGELRSVYYREVEALVARVAGASRVVIFDHTLRSGEPERQEQSFAREPVQVVHNDYTERSGPWRVEDVLPEEAKELLARRFAIVQVWRPMRAVRAYPLALCDARTVSPEDLVATERRHPKRVGEIYQLAYSPAHRWFYFPDMQPEEAIVFKVYDSQTEGRARFTPHTSFELPGALGGIRESIEARCLAFF